MDKQEVNETEKGTVLISCRVRRGYAEKVKAKAAAQGVAVNAVLKAALDDFLGSDAQPVPGGDLVVKVPGELAAAARGAAQQDGQTAEGAVLDALSAQYLGHWWNR